MGEAKSKDLQYPRAEAAEGKSGGGVGEKVARSDLAHAPHGGHRGYWRSFDSAPFAARSGAPLRMTVGFFDGRAPHAKAKPPKTSLSS